MVKGGQIFQNHEKIDEILDVKFLNIMTFYEMETPGSNENFGGKNVSGRVIANA